MTEMTPQRIEKVAQSIMQEIGLDQDLASFHRLNSDMITTIRQNAVNTLEQSLKNHRDRGDAVAEPFLPMLYVLIAIERAETRPHRMMRTYHAIQQVIYAHQAAFVNSEGYLVSFREIYPEGPSERVDQAIRYKCLEQLAKDTEYLRLKYGIDKPSVNEAKLVMEKRREALANGTDFVDPTAPNNRNNIAIALGFLEKSRQNNALSPAFTTVSNILKKLPKLKEYADKDVHRLDEIV